MPDSLTRLVPRCVSWRIPHSRRSDDKKTRVGSTGRLVHFYHDAVTTPSSPRKRGPRACPWREQGEIDRCINVRRPCVYIPASRRHGTLYIGITSDIARRAWEHRSDAVGGFVRDHRVHRLVFVEFHETMADAILREKRLKKWRRAWKLELIERHNPQWRDLYEELT